MPSAIVSLSRDSCQTIICLPFRGPARSLARQTGVRSNQGFAESGHWQFSFRRHPRSLRKGLSFQQLHCTFLPTRHPPSATPGTPPTSPDRRPAPSSIPVPSGKSRSYRASGQQRRATSSLRPKLGVTRRPKVSFCTTTQSRLAPARDDTSRLPREDKLTHSRLLQPHPEQELHVRQPNTRRPHSPWVSHPSPPNLTSPPHHHHLRIASGRLPARATRHHVARRGML